MAARALNAARREYVLILLGTGFILFRVIGFIDAEPRIYPDTGTYEHVARAPILSADFLAGWRSPTLPLLYKLVTGIRPGFGHSSRSRSCAGLRWPSRPPRRSASAGCGQWPLRPYWCCARPEIVLWDAALLSESVSLSLTAALTASWLWIVRRPSPWAYAAMLALAAAWAMARDPHPYGGSGAGPGPGRLDRLVQ